MLLRTIIAPLQEGKGLMSVYVWLSLASNRSKVIAIHDCDILTYYKEMLTRLIYPVPILVWTLVTVRAIMHESLTAKWMVECVDYSLPQLLVHLKTCGETDYLDYMDSFKYALSGEFAFKEIISEIRIPSDWGLEMDMLRNLSKP